MNDLDKIKKFKDELDEASNLLSTFIEGNRGYKVAGKKFRVLINQVKKNTTDIKKLTM